MGWDDEMESLAGHVEDAFGVSATYRRVTPGAYTAATGKRESTTADTAVTISRSASRSEEGLKRKVEMISWVLKADQIAFDPRVGDRIVVDTGTVHEITGVEKCCNGHAWDISTARTSA